MIRTVKLSGELAKRYGRLHKLDIATPAEAIRALCANFPDFRRFMASSEERNVGYKVIVDKDLLPDVAGVHNPFSRTVHIVPVIGGAKSGFLGILIGAALIGAAFLTGGASLGASGVVFSGLAGQVAFGIGVSLVLSGISSLLSPQPKAPKPAEQTKNEPSYTFNGAVNTTAQGHAVPVGYGRLIVGSQVISAGITADDYTTAGLA